MGLMIWRDGLVFNPSKVYGKKDSMMNCLYQNIEYIFPKKMGKK